MMHSRQFRWIVCYEWENPFGGDFMLYNYEDLRHPGGAKNTKILIIIRKWTVWRIYKLPWHKLNDCSEKQMTRPFPLCPETLTAGKCVHQNFATRLSFNRKMTFYNSLLLLFYHTCKYVSSDSSLKLEEKKNKLFAHSQLGCLSHWLAKPHKYLIIDANQPSNLGVS